MFNAIKCADYIFAGHSHAITSPTSHSSPNSSVQGNRLAHNEKIALTGGVDIILITISGGENLDFKDFSVQVIDKPARHLIRPGVNSGQSLRKLPSLGPGPSWRRFR